MKLKKLILPVGLAVAVLVSLGMSGMLWTNPAHSNLNDSTKPGNSNDNATNASFREVNLPNQIIYTDKAGNQSLLSNSETNLAAEFQGLLGTFSTRQVATVSNHSETPYFDQLNRKNSVVLDLGNVINSQYFKSVYNQKFRISNRNFNRVQLLTNDSAHIYLLNDSTKQVSRVTVTGNSQSKLNDILTEPRVATQVEFRNWHGRPLVYYPKKTTMKVYSYQATQQSESYYANRIMTTNTNSNMQVKKHKTSTTYDDRGFRHMVVNRNDGTVTFTNYDSQTGSSSFLTMMQRAYSQMVMVGIPLDNVRLYSYDAKQHQIIFRTYVEGMPVFNQTGFGAVRTKILGQDSYRMNFSLASLQVPIPPSTQTTTVMSTTELLAKLAALGISAKKIDDIQLGYHWTWDKTLKKVVNLVPTWYVSINHRWNRYDTLVNGQ
ncbi:YycH family regulatory protein [uncultured Secundilactobacillus sp.]|uniref:YycH family regulatory protein n=1 Tax=uncultured Secundilactobacillus sp. TaxID=2813935 RepID=UPI00258F58DD|nr:two-component system activity regulator YycH [uncultured Secundilactobacillus sp.]